MRFRRLAVVPTVVLAMVATTNTSSAVPTSPSDAAPVAEAGQDRSLPTHAVSPVQPRGKWYRTIHQRVDGAGPDVADNRQTLIKITGPKARQRFRFHVDLPSGARLVQRGNGVAAMDERGSLLGVLEAPWAVDAKGIQVSTRFDVLDRNTFVQVVEHRPVGATYPVFADPWWVVPILIREGARLLGRYVVRRATYEAAKRAAAKMAAEQASMDIDDLLAKSPVRLLKLNRANFRENVRRRTGWAKSSTKGYDAHHTLPVKFEAAFNRAGLNIHNPVFGHWWCARAHRRHAAAYNRQWNRWLEPRRDDITNSSEWRTAIERKRIAMVSKPWASTYQCPN
jgi:hypothetical protein